MKTETTLSQVLDFAQDRIHQLSGRETDSDSTMFMMSARDSDYPYVIPTLDLLINQLHASSTMSPPTIVVGWNKSIVPAQVTDYLQQIGQAYTVYDNLHPQEFTVSDIKAGDKNINVVMLNQSSPDSPKGKLGMLYNITELLLVNKHALPTLAHTIIMMDAESQTPDNLLALAESVNSHKETVIGACNINSVYKNHVPDPRIPIALEQEKSNSFSPLFNFIWGSGYSFTTTTALGIIQTAYNFTPHTKSEDGMFMLIAENLGFKSHVEKSVRVYNRVPAVWEHRESRKQAIRWGASVEDLRRRFNAKHDNDMSNVDNTTFRHIRNEAAKRMLIKAHNYQHIDSRSIGGAAIEILNEVANIGLRRIGIDKNKAAIEKYLTENQEYGWSRD